MVRENSIYIQCYYIICVKGINTKTNGIEKYIFRAACNMQEKISGRIKKKLITLFLFSPFSKGIVINYTGRREKFFPVYLFDWYKCITHYLNKDFKFLR